MALAETFDREDLLLPAILVGALGTATGTYIGFGLAALAFIPYVDRNPSVRPSDRKLAISIFTVYFMAAAVLTIFGSFFRGPGFNFTFPWRDGIFFDDLLTILE